MGLICDVTFKVVDASGLWNSFSQSLRKVTLVYIIEKHIMLLDYVSFKLLVLVKHIAPLYF